MKEMRADAAKLGWGKEANTARGNAAVAAVLEQARASPREARGEGREGGRDGSDGDDDDGSEEEETFYVADIVDVKVKRGRRLYRTQWEGWVAGDDDTWEPAENLPAEMVAAFEKARAGDPDETDDEDEGAGEESESEGEEGGAPAPAPPPVESES